MKSLFNWSFNFSLHDHELTRILVDRHSHNLNSFFLFLQCSQNVFKIVICWSSATNFRVCLFLSMTVPHSISLFHLTSGRIKSLGKAINRVLNWFKFLHLLLKKLVLFRFHNKLSVCKFKLLLKFAIYNDESWHYLLIQLLWSEDLCL